MIESESKIKMRLAWVKMYQQTPNAGLVCRRCGISRPTLRKWVRRYQALGLEGLKDQSRRPKTGEPKKIFPQQRQWIKVQRRLMELKIKSRPTKPRSPHLNGKVERSQRTDLEEFYELVDLKAPDLLEQLQQWQDYYNRERKHGSINQTPWHKWES